MDTPIPPLPTVGEIARRLGQSVHRIEYVIRSRQIPPASLAGGLRVFSEEAVERIAAVLALMDRKNGVPERK